MVLKLRSELKSINILMYIQPGVSTFPLPFMFEQCIHYLTAEIC